MPSELNTRRRMISLFVISGGILLLLLVSLFRLAVVEGRDPDSLYVHSGISYETTVSAARGEIRDSRGRTLVGNSATYSLVIDRHRWDTSCQNETILRLIDVMKGYDETYVDLLPITFAPYAYTSDVTSDERKTLRDFIAERNWSDSLSAGEIYEKLLARYGLKNADYTDAQKRVIAGVRYSMEVSYFSYLGTYTFAEKVDPRTVALIKENAFTFAGVDAKACDVREYRTAYAAHILGRIGAIYKEEYEELKALGYPMDARVGKDGAEKAFESYLRGIDGKERTTLDTDDNIIGREYTVEPKVGHNVYLSIDMTLQQAAEDALANRIQKIKELSETSRSYPKDVGGGAALVMEVNTGKILAMASYPTYDLTTFNADYSSLLADPLTPMLNRCIGAVYPPASTFKVITATAALEEKVITGSSTVNCTGVYRYFKDYQPRCWILSKGRTHGTLNVSGAISNSCNIFFYDTGRRLGITKLDLYAKAFGLGEKTGIEISGEVKGWRSNADTKAAMGAGTWYPGDVLQTAIGQSYTLVTPLQLAGYISAVANGGTLYRPTLLDRVTTFDDKSVVYTQKPVVNGTVSISESTRKLVIQGMLDVTENGTAASVFRNVDFTVAGKTGSAQVPNGSENAVFAAFAPVDKPEICVVVIVEHGSSGNSIAIIARQIFETYFNMSHSTGTTR